MADTTTEEKEKEKKEDEEDKTMYYRNIKNKKKVKIEENGERIKISVPKQTDLWRLTKNGFTLENAPFYYRSVKGNFMVSVKVTSKLLHMYDQAGILIRDSENTYIRCGLENFISSARKDAIARREHIACATSAVTKELTDWASMPLDFLVECGERKECWFAVKRRGDCVEAFYSKDGEDYKQMRLAQLTKKERVHVGLYGACPEGDGLKVVFEHFEIEHLPDEEEFDDDDYDDEDDEDEGELEQIEGGEPVDEDEAAADGNESDSDAEDLD